MLEGFGPETVALAQKGDVNSVTAIYEHFHRSVFRFLYYRVGDRQAAEDLTSEVFIQMVRNLPGYRPQGVPFNAWLFRIARNLATDHFRKTGKSGPTRIEEEATTSPDETVGSEETIISSKQFRRALAKLGHDQRDVIVLRFVSGLTLAEVAVSLNKSLDAVKALQRRGLASLHDILANGEVMNA